VSLTLCSEPARVNFISISFPLHPSITELNSSEEFTAFPSAWVITSFTRKPADSAGFASPEAVFYLSLMCLVHGDNKNSDQ
jgi:hypothetical protein